MQANVAIDRPIDVAIIGGGIIGVVLALGLLKRDISFTIYERAPAFREIGAGIGFTPNAERAMIALNSGLHDVFKKVSTPNTEDWFQWVDGYNHDDVSDPHGVKEELIFKLYCGKRGFEGCRRQDFLEGLVRLIPEKNIKYGKSIVTVTDKEDGAQVLMGFQDGSTSEADIVIGCDGIRSSMRRIMFGEEHPATHPSYTHKFAFRGLIPMARARAALGNDKASTRFMHLGPDAHVLTFPVAMGTFMNVVAFVTDAEDWSLEAGKFTTPATKDDAVRAFAGFGPAVRAIMGLLPDKLDKWAIFDTRDHPAPTYAQGRLCLAGDAAHASAPHHGAGAGHGIEDALVLATVIKAVENVSVGSRVSRIGTALRTYNAIRYERTQWLVESSRVVGELFEWQDEARGRDPEKFGREIDWRSHQIWDYNIDEMIRDTEAQFSQRLQTESPS
ncbi:MAG: hypothetical protein LQ349_000471 [Xanthoria aureola]|nr:MAG: hypothetical protein LQ349_000471 [Xanthoria aureola]